MLHRIALALVIVSCVLLLSARKADPQSDEQVWDSGNSFLLLCQQLGKPTEELNSLQLQHSSWCISYLNGVTDGVNLEVTLSNQAGNLALLPFCVPPEVKKMQAYLVLVKYVQDNPAQAHLPTATLFGTCDEGRLPMS